MKQTWSVVVGDPARRNKITEALNKATQALEELFRDLLSSEDKDIPAQFERIGRVPPSRILAELKLYASLVNMAKKLGVETETHSMREFCKYLLSAYVKHATGNYRDRNVSAVIGEINNSADYVEVTQRMWRLRNYNRMNKNHAKIVGFLHAFGLAVTHKT